MQFNPRMVRGSLCMQIGQLRYNIVLIISMQCINHAAKPVQCSTLCILVQAGTHRGLAGGGKKLLLAGSSQQGSTPGKGVRGGLRWETNDIWAWFIFDYATCRKD